MGFNKFLAIIKMELKHAYLKLLESGKQQLLNNENKNCISSGTSYKGVIRTTWPLLPAPVECNFKVARVQHGEMS